MYKDKALALVLACVLILPSFVCIQVFSFKFTLHKAYHLSFLNQTFLI